MPFNIEVSVQNHLSIKLQVVKNTISVYCNGEEWAAKKVLKAWGHLESHFLSSMPEYNNNWVRGPDAPHVKRNHTNHYEVPIMHFHREFHTEITPQMLAYYLNQLLAQQYLHSGREYQLLEDYRVKEVINTFDTYYWEYKNSINEQLFEEEHALTEDEQALYQKAVNEQSHEDLFTMLLSNSFFNRKPSFPITRQIVEEKPAASIFEDLRKILFENQTKSSNENSEVENCVIM